MMNENGGEKGRDATVRLFVRALVGLALSVVSACRTRPELAGGNPAVAGSRGEVEFSVQHWQFSDCPDDVTVEVLIRNGTREMVRYARVDLDGTPLPETAAEASRALRSFVIDGLGPSARRRLASPQLVAGARWWRQDPPGAVNPGGFAVFQLNFSGKPRACELGFATADGSRRAVRIPRASPPSRRIEHLAFSSDGRCLSLRHSPGEPPRALLVNGKGVAFRALEPASPSRSGAVVADLPEPVEEGECVLVEAEFPDGSRRFAFTRVLRGVCTVAPRDAEADDVPLPDAVRASYGFDADMRVWRIPCDVVCEDARAHEHGASAWDALAKCAAKRKSAPKELCGADFCTALYPSAWNIYAPIGDVAVVKPYKLHWGKSLSRFVDEEDAFLGDVVTRVAPRPVMWVPERFRSLRELDGAEFSVLAWCAVLRGVRGIRVHHWLNDPLAPFDGNPGLAEAVKGFNADFNRIRHRLERLIPAGAGEDRAARVAVLEGWCGDDGVLLLVRNLRYDTGIDTGTKRRVRPFSVETVASHTLSYRLPKWLEPDAAVDALTGERLECETADGVCRVTVPQLGAYRLVWIGNAGKGKEVKQ